MLAVSIEALLCVLFSVGLFLAGVFLLTARRFTVWFGLSLAFALIVITLIGFMSLGVEEYGRIEVFNHTTNETIVKPLYRENPYVNFLYAPLIVLIAALLKYVALLFIRTTKWIVE